MAIKINNQDLQARYINWNSIGKVMLNNEQIRPALPPTPVSTAGTYWNKTLWIVSFSTDWTNWTSLLDKNLWATTVYAPDKFHVGEWVNVNNCWDFYQWWNNYWFPWSWNITTSPTTVDITWYGEWNYYNSSTFITEAERFTWSMSAKMGLWEWTWPCPSWTHVWHVYDYTNSPRKTYYFLHLPLGWIRQYSTWDVSNVWEWTIYHRGDYNTITPWFWNIYSGKLWDGGFVRPFLDTPIVPDTSWERMSFIEKWSYWSPTLWLISFTLDWVKRYTISDKNLWASVVYSTGDTVTTTNSWYYYQRWNNCGFTEDGLVFSGTTVDVTWYGVNNYYYNAEMHGNFTPAGTDLWGGFYNYHVSGDLNRAKNVITQWPCPSWWHVPNYNEFNDFWNFGYNYGISSLKLSPAWYISGWNGRIYQKWTKSAYMENYALFDNYDRNTFYHEYIENSWWTAERSWNAYPIRPFKDTPVRPDSTWTVLYEELSY